MISGCRSLAGAGGGEVRRQRSVLKVGPAQRTYENRQVCELGPGRGGSADLDHPEAGRRSEEGQFHRHGEKHLKKRVVNIAKCCRD